MAQLSIPQSLIGALIDIADLGTLDYFPPTERCAHWSLYDAQRQELLCPCAPAANPTDFVICKDKAPLPLRTRRQRHHGEAL